MNSQIMKFFFTILLLCFIFNETLGLRVTSKSSKINLLKVKCINCHTGSPGNFDPERCFMWTQKKDTYPLRVRVKGKITLKYHVTFFYGCDLANDIKIQVNFKKNMNLDENAYEMAMENGVSVDDVNVNPVEEMSFKLSKHSKFNRTIGIYMSRDEFKQFTENEKLFKYGIHKNLYNFSEVSKLECLKNNMEFIYETPTIEVNQDGMKFEVALDLPFTEDTQDLV